MSKELDEEKEISYITFVLGADLLPANNQKFDAVDEYYEKCKALATAFYHSKYNDGQKPLYDCLETYVKEVGTEIKHKYKITLTADIEKNKIRWVDDYNYDRLYSLGKSQEKAVIYSDEIPNDPDAILNNTILNYIYKNGEFKVYENENSTKPYGTFNEYDEEFTHKVYSNHSVEKNGDDYVYDITITNHIEENNLEQNQDYLGFTDNLETNKNNESEEDEEEM